jgi:hypothetical protein
VTGGFDKQREGLIGDKKRVGGGGRVLQTINRTLKGREGAFDWGCGGWGESYDGQTQERVPTMDRRE